MAHRPMAKLLALAAILIAGALLGHFLVPRQSPVALHELTFTLDDKSVPYSFVLDNQGGDQITAVVELVAETKGESRYGTRLREFGRERLQVELVPGERRKVSGRREAPCLRGWSFFVADAGFENQARPHVYLSWWCSRGRRSLTETKSPGTLRDRG